MFDAASRGRRTFAAVMAGFCVVALTGCQSQESADTGGPLTREEFIEKGNAICEAGNAKIEASFPPEEEWPPSGPEGEAFFQTLLETITGIVDDVAALNPPADLQPEMESIIADTRVVLAEMEEQGSESFFETEEDPFMEVNTRLAAVGLTVCAEDPGAE